MFSKAKEDELALIGNMQDAFNELPDSTKKALTTKAKEHNEQVEQNKAKTTTKLRLAVVYWRGIGAYKTNPSSVRPSVSSPEQWAMGRVNSYLFALRNGRFRSGKHDTDLLPKDHPMSGKDEKKNYPLVLRGSVGDVDPTNFPEDGEDQQVALRNSQWERFPHAEALDLKKNFPEIWDEGGNILGNKQFNRLLPIAQRDSSIAQTETEEKAIRLREAWGARHFRDHRLAGVVAQIKWLVVGSRGLDHMRAVISEEKQRLRDKQKGRTARSKEQKDQRWRQWEEKTYSPAHRQIMRASEIYLEQAAQRYVRRAEILRTEILNQQQNKSISYSTILGRAVEIASIKKIIGRAYRSVYLLTGSDQIEELYGILGKTRPLDLVFGQRNIDERQIAKMAKQITATSERQIKRIVRRGIQQGLPNAEIAKQITTATTFSQARAMRIAQTETTKAINTATNQAYVEFQETEKVKVMKEWISSRDGDVRPLHEELDLEPPIPVQDDFEIEGYSAPSPANFGDASMDINCRCTMAPVIIED